MSENDDNGNREQTQEEVRVDTKDPSPVASPAHGPTDDAAKLPATLHERFLQIKEIVKDAIAARHTFMVYGRAKVIRECLLKKGWVEKLYRRSSNVDQQLQGCPQQQQQQQQSSHVGVDSSPVVLLSGIGDLKDEQSQRLLISKMLANHTVDFLWNSGSDWPGWPSQENKSTIFNRYSRAGFTSKIGLSSNVRQMHWYYEPGVANTLFPRCYNICQADHLHAFVDDYRLTACLSLLKWLVERTDSQGEIGVVSQTGQVPVNTLDFAIRRCSDYIAAQSHEDLDKESERVWSHQWDRFIGWYYKIVSGETLFFSSNTPMNKYIHAAKYILNRMRRFWPQLDMDGVGNVWILKPGNKSRGRGIVLVNRIEDVVAKVSPANKSDMRYVVQKYIERPLLIYNTKFDIRQWFIVTSAQPLTLWMYRESYLRFCSQDFRLNDLHESVHLSNHAVQCKYKNAPDRDPALPKDNMWDATTFKQFLKSQGHADAWDELIYPGMRQSLVGSLLSSQEAMDRRRNSFELYGADFMVMEDFSVWLIEINSHPDMSYSTSVTTRLCKQVMEDTIKVVIDFREDKSADTGLFELAYKQRMPSCQPYLGSALSVQGTRINAGDKKLNSESKLTSKLQMSCVSRKKSTANSYIGPVIVDLIEDLEVQLDRELNSYCKYNFESGTTSPISPPAVSSCETSLTPAVIGESPSTSSAQKSSDATSPSQSRVRDETMRKTTGRIVKESSRKLDVSSARQNAVSSVIKSKKPSTTTGDSRKIPNNQKLIAIALRNSPSKYMKYETVPLDLSPSASSHAAVRSSTRTSRTSMHRKRKNTQNKQKKRDQVTSDNTSIYAVGLGITK